MSFQHLANSRYPSGPIFTANPIDRLSSVLGDVWNSSWEAVKTALIDIFGGPTFAIGAVYGAGESVVTSVGDLLVLMKTLALADLADAVFQTTKSLSWSEQLNRILQGGSRTIAALIAKQFFRDQLSAAQKDRDAMIEALRYAIAHPKEVLGAIGQTYIDKWKRFEEMIVKPDLASRFEAGKIFGVVLLEVLGLLAAGAGFVKLAAKVPSFARIATKFKAAAGGVKQRFAKSPKASISPEPTKIQTTKKGETAVVATTSRVQTKPNEAFFWSGRSKDASGKTVGGAERAAEIARSKGGTTLETLIEERNIKMPDWNPNDPKAVKAWADISAEYAANASGEIKAVIGAELRPGNIWETRELPALKRNLNVTKITTIDPITGAQKLIFP